MNGKKRRKYQAILFDKDGVLIDSIDACLIATNESFKHYGKAEVSKEEFKKHFWGTRADINIAKKFGGSSQGEIDEVQDYYNNKKLEFKSLINIYPSIIQVLEALKDRYKLGVVTSSSKSVSVELLKEFGILDFFDVVIGGKDTEPKPAPDPILKACELLDTDSKQTLYVGDTKPDIESAKAAGCDVVMLTTSLSREELEGIEGITIIDDLKELLEIVA
jgi:HAD superfamily hydrolase (TIGR01509 family)